MDLLKLVATCHFGRNKTFSLKILRNCQMDVWLNDINYNINIIIMKSVTESINERLHSIMKSLHVNVDILYIYHTKFIILFFRILCNRVHKSVLWRSKYHQSLHISSTVDFLTIVYVFVLTDRYVLLTITWTLFIRYNVISTINRGTAWKHYFWCTLSHNNIITSQWRVTSLQWSNM